MRTRAIKLIYVLSRASNHKSGSLQELHIAISVARKHGFKDFVIPLRLDDLPHSDINIQLARLNAIDFSAGWPSGFRSLLAKLELDGVSKDSRFSPEIVASWWKTNGIANVGLIRSPETYLSNWFVFRRLPDFIYVHSTTGLKGRTIKSMHFSYPLRRKGRYLISFASAHDLMPNMPSGTRIISSSPFLTQDLITGRCHALKLTSGQSRNFVVDLLRQGWNNLIKSKGMLTYRLSNGSFAAYLEQGQIRGNKVSIPIDSGRPRQRVLVGRRSRRVGKQRRKRYWHFAIESRPVLGSLYGYKIIPHLLFSDDGQRIWTSKSRQHKARRAESKNWWNPEWRDRTLGFMDWLAGNCNDISIRLGSKAFVQVKTRPITFKSPISYKDPGTTGMKLG